jgi:hypothetical protein
MQPMATFDPTQPCELHDQLNDIWFQWPVKDAELYRGHAEPWDTPGVIAFDGMLLDGWRIASSSQNALR